MVTKVRPVVRKRLTPATTMSEATGLNGATVVDSRLTLPEVSDNEIISTGMDAWEWCKANTDQTWEHWKRVGAALLVGRECAKREAGTYNIRSDAYRCKFGPWLREHGFADMDKSVRADLINIMENLEAVEAYLADLAKQEPLKRARWTHPCNIWDAFTCPDRGNRGKPKDNGHDNTAAHDDTGDDEEDVEPVSAPSPSLDKDFRREKERLNEIKWQLNLTVRASNARGLAKMGDWLLDGPPDPLWIQAAREAAQAWTDLADRLEAVAISFEEAA